MGNFTDQQPRVATEKDVKAPWAGGKCGKWFRCNLCGHKFKVGDVWRWYFGGGVAPNFAVCEKCDGEDALERWVALRKEYEAACDGKFWWFTKEIKR